MKYDDRRSKLYSKISTEASSVKNDTGYRPSEPEWVFQEAITASQQIRLSNDAEIYLYVLIF